MFTKKPERAYSCINIDGVPGKKLSVGIFGLCDNMYTLSDILPSMQQSCVIEVFKQIFVALQWRKIFDCRFAIYNMELLYDDVKLHIDAHAEKQVGRCLITIKTKLGVVLWMILCDLVGRDVAGIVMNMLMYMPGQKLIY
jgi:hypothetical protein